MNTLPIFKKNMIINLLNVNLNEFLMIINIVQMLRLKYSIIQRRFHGISF